MPFIYLSKNAPTGHINAYTHQLDADIHALNGYINIHT